MRAPNSAPRGTAAALTLLRHQYVLLQLLQRLLPHAMEVSHVWPHVVPGLQLLPAGAQGGARTART